MKTVGIRNLKNSLSQYIKLAKAGERILITEHDKIVAQIIPPTTTPADTDLLHEYLAEQEKLNTIIRAKNKFTLKKTRGKIVFDNAQLKAIYNETRADRL